MGAADDIASVHRASRYIRILIHIHCLKHQSRFDRPGNDAAVYCFIPICLVQLP